MNQRRKALTVVAVGGVGAPSHWSRSGRPEAFYTCSDVTFGGTPPNTPPPNVPALWLAR